MKVVLALYKNQAPGWGSYATFDRLSRFVGGSFIDKKWVPGKYSHCELVLPIEGKWASFSSSFRDGGVRFKEIDYTTGNWDFIELDRTYEEIIKIQARFELVEGCKYDWPALGKFIFKKYWPIDIRWWFFCSEIVAMLLKLENPNKWHPCDLVKLGIVKESLE